MRSSRGSHDTHLPVFKEPCYTCISPNFAIRGFRRHVRRCHTTIPSARQRYSAYTVPIALDTTLYPNVQPSPVIGSAQTIRFGRASAPVYLSPLVQLMLRLEPDPPRKTRFSPWESRKSSPETCFRVRFLVSPKASALEGEVLSSRRVGSVHHGRRQLASLASVPLPNLILAY